MLMTWWTLAMATTLCSDSIATNTPAQENSGQKEEAAEKGPKKLCDSTLQELVEEARRSSPVLQQAELHVLEAHSLLQDARMRAAREALEAYQALQDGRLRIAQASEANARVQQMQQAQVVGPTDIAESHRAVMEAQFRYRLAVLDSNYLLGVSAKGDRDPFSDEHLPKSLEEFLERALSNHLPTRLKELAVEQAQTAANEARLGLERSISLQFLEIDRCRHRLESARGKLVRARALEDEGHVSHEEVDLSIRELADVETALAKIEAELRYLTGRSLRFATKGAR